MRVNKVFIIHYTKLDKRKLHMIDQMNRWFPETEFEFIENHDQEDLTDHQIHENFDLDLFQKKFNREMLRSEMSICLKYKEAVGLASKQKGTLFFLLEDDIIFKENPEPYISMMTAFCEKESIQYDCVFLGEAWIRKDDERNIFAKKEYPSTNGLCTVLYTKKSLQRLNDFLKGRKITQPMDWELNDVFRDLDFNVYWGKTLTSHGSVKAMTDKDFDYLKSSLREKY